MRAGGGVVVKRLQMRRALGPWREAAHLPINHGGSNHTCPRRRLASTPNALADHALFFVCVFVFACLFPSYCKVGTHIFSPGGGGAHRSVAANYTSSRKGGWRRWRVGRLKVFLAGRIKCCWFCYLIKQWLITCLSARHRFFFFCPSLNEFTAFIWI